MSLAGLKYFLTKPGGWFFFLSSRGLLNRMDDEAYIKRVFKYSLGYELDLEHPKTYNEKLNWLKLHDRRPLYTRIVDKYEVKGYVAEKIGEQYVVPVIAGPWDSADEIDFDALPERFVLKCTHDSGGVVICRDKAAFDREAAKAKLARALGRNFYWSNREWPYKNVKPRVFAERYLEDESGGLRDYKVMCFNGVPRLIQVHNGRFSHHTQDYYDTDWNRLPFEQGIPMSAQPDDRPDFLDELLSLSALLSASFPHVRVDFFHADGQLYVGELTLYDSSGFERFEPPSYDRMLGDLIDLGKV